MEEFLNKITLGNFFELSKGIPDKSVDLCVTDPPYQIHAESGGGLHKSRDWLKNIHESGLDSFDPIAFLEEMKRILKIFNAYIFCSKDLFTTYIEWFKEQGYNWDWLVLAKRNPIPTKNYKYLPDREMCFFVREKGGVTFNCDCEYNKYRGFFNMNVRAAKYHPTEKPFEAIQGYVEISSNEGDIVIDPFMGSGTTAAACKSLGRQFIGFEIDPKFHEMSLNKVSGISHKVKMKDTMFDLEDF